ncbi:MAG TPA: alpha/beta hydrolase [Candidatus Eisenbacteria bacterium]|nr:alpha/beta hydrolase [Candidatus Eisenbacteria bacterium]
MDEKDSPAEGRLSRRTTLKIACGVGATIVASSAEAQGPAQAPRVKGPLVWMDMDQKELDDAYDQSVWAPNQQHVSKRRAVWSQSVRARLKPERVSYGPTEFEKLDIYKTSRPNAPIRIFLHGGAWRGGSAENSAFPAEMFVNAGAHYVAVDFINVLEAGGNLMPMADQVRRAVAWVYKNAARFGGDPNRIYISGHSSGGHLAGVVMVTDWEKDFGVPRDIVKAGLLMSGMYDLKAVRLSKRSSYVKFTDEIEHALSTQRHLDKLNAPIIVSYGTLESPEFHRQARDFVAAVKAAGKPVELIVAEGYNHFETQETFGNPYGLLGRAALEQMNLVIGP